MNQLCKKQMILILWKNTDGSDETKLGKLVMTKLSWRMLILKLSDKYKVFRFPQNINDD